MKEVNKPMGQLAEVLGVLSVEVVVGEEVVVKVVNSEGGNCLRCRRLVAGKGEEVCGRCRDALQDLL